MKRTILLGIALLVAVGVAHAQSAGSCPTLPASSGLAWEKLDGAGYTFCKAIRGADGHQVLAVMITGESPFRPRRGNRVQEAVIDGNETWWYRGDVSSGNVEVRETLVEVGRNHVAHISLRGASEDDLSRGMAVAETLRFDDVRLSIN